MLTTACYGNIICRLCFELKIQEPELEMLIKEIPCIFSEVFKRGHHPRFYYESRAPFIIRFGPIFSILKFKPKYQKSLKRRRHIHNMVDLAKEEVLIFFHKKSGRTSGLQQERNCFDHSQLQKI
ncbi:hypothetical protein T265_03140 [Opisthorchis viverrini]|uniref:Uncharacterized protein n=1 Tax=Opisthorchis viverrini TaxID=6198 RepID=A0A075A485_OPIVI|nr:hypothetical protein T265_03140 [Opisthorchis viverrini]KER30405.1 hypothetical protein T265_03140 [Opisthorchis viverrini]